MRTVFRERNEQEMKPGGQYAKGASREREWVKRCYAQGALWAARIAGSHSPIDVVAVYPLITVLYQLKSGSAKLPDEDRNELKRLSSKVSSTTFVVLVSWIDRQEPLCEVFSGKGPALILHDPRGVRRAD